MIISLSGSFHALRRRLPSRRKHRADPPLYTFGVNVYPVVRPIDRFRLPADAFQILAGELSGRFPDVAGLKDETVVEHEGQELIECDLLRPDLSPCVAEALEVGINLSRAEQCFSERQRGVNDVETAVQS